MIYSRLRPYLPVFTAGFSLHGSQCFLMDLHHEQLLLRAYWRAAEHGDLFFGLLFPEKAQTKCYKKYNI